MMPLRMVAGTEFPVWQRLSSHFSNFPNGFQSAGIWVQVYALSAFKPQDTNGMCIVHVRSNKYLYKCHGACKWHGFQYVLAWDEALIKRHTYKWVKGKHLLSGCWEMTIIKIVLIFVTYTCYMELYQNIHWGQRQWRLTNEYLNSWQKWFILRLQKNKSLFTDAEWITWLLQATAYENVIAFIKHWIEWIHLSVHYFSCPFFF